MTLNEEAGFYAGFFILCTRQQEYYRAFLASHSSSEGNSTELFLTHELPKNQTAKEEPQPQDEEAFGLLKVKPRLFKPLSQSICIPYKYNS